MFITLGFGNIFDPLIGVTTKPWLLSTYPKYPEPLSRLVNWNNSARSIGLRRTVGLQSSISPHFNHGVPSRSFIQKTHRNLLGEGCPTGSLSALDPSGAFSLLRPLTGGVEKNPYQRMSRWKLGSMVSKWNITYLKIGVYWGYNPFTKHWS